MNTAESMPTASESTSLHLRALAVIMGLLSIQMLFGAGDIASFDGGLRLAIATLGVVTTVGIWSGASWMFKAYCLWIAMALAAGLRNDMQVESVPWKLAIGIAIPAAIWTLVGSWVYRAQQTLALRRAV